MSLIAAQAVNNFKSITDECHRRLNFISAIDCTLLALYSHLIQFDVQEMKIP